MRSSGSSVQTITRAAARVNPLLINVKVVLMAIDGSEDNGMGGAPSLLMRPVPHPEA